MTAQEQKHPPNERGTVLADVANAMVRLHKQQFGRGPTAARANYTGDDGMVVSLREGLLPAERGLVELGEIQRVQESRLFFQEATRGLFIDAIEEIVQRKVTSFASACDPRTEVIWEIFEFEPATGPRATPSRQAPRIAL